MDVNPQEKPEWCPLDEVPTKYTEEKNEKKNEAPFEVICSKCGSHNVNVAAFDFLDLEIKCKNCGNHIVYGCYNEVSFEN